MFYDYYGIGRIMPAHVVQYCAVLYAFTLSLGTYIYPGLLVLKTVFPPRTGGVMAFIVIDALFAIVLNALFPISSIPEPMVTLIRFEQLEND